MAFMKFLRGMAAAIWFAFCGMAFAQGPDTTYVGIYNLIQSADSLRTSGQAPEAVLRYREAQKELLSFRQTYPDWHQNIVAYRLNYIASRLEPLLPKTAGTNAPPSAAGGPEESQAATEGQLKQLQEMIQRLTSQNTLLQEKLKEAWQAQPTVMDPKELAKAQQRIRDLEKERDLLEVALDQRPQTPPPPDAAALEQERQLLDQVKKQLAAQVEINTALKTDNETLKKQLADLKVGTPVAPVTDSDLSRQLAAATATIESLRATNVSLLTQQILLETRVADLAKAASQVGSSDQLQALESELKSAKSTLKEAEKERDDLRKKLLSALNRLEKKSGDSELEKELLQAQARLDALDAKAVPYTPEELSLVGHQSEVALNLTKDSTAPPPKKTQELPPGAGPIITEALRALDNGRLEEAESKFTEVLHQDEKNVFILGSLGGVKLQMKKTAEAEALLQKALSLDANDPASLYYLGVLKFQAKKFDDALDALSRSAKLKPDKPETQYYLGMTLMHKGNRGPAETAFRKAIQIRPGWGDAHYELAVVYATQKPPFRELAQWHYQKAISGGTPRNFDLEKLIEGATATP
jgi:Flp pilus assembly protein TadD